MYQDGVIKVSDIKYAFKANPDTTTITFKLPKNGQPFDPKQVDNINIYWVPFKDGKFQFEPAADRLSLKGKITSDGKGTVTSTLVELPKDDKAFVDYTDVSKTDGLLVIYGRDEHRRDHPEHARRPEQVPVRGPAADRRGRGLRVLGQRRRLRQVPHRSVPQARLHLRHGRRRPQD